MGQSWKPKSQGSGTVNFEEEPIGEVDHYYNHLGIAGIHMESGRLKLGDQIHIKGHTTDLKATVMSMQVDHMDVREVGKGAHVGVPIQDKVRVHDRVYLIHS